MSGCNEPQRSTDDAHNSFSPEDGFVLLLPPPICTSVMLAARVQRNRRVSSTRASYRSRVRRAPRVRAAASPGLAGATVLLNLYVAIFAYLSTASGRNRATRPAPAAYAEADPHANHRTVTVLVCSQDVTAANAHPRYPPVPRPRAPGAGRARRAPRRGRFRICSLFR